jgi:hypothetical protein
MCAKATWIEGRAFMLESGSGPRIVADAPVEAGSRALDRAAVERAGALSAEKYCSATIMLGRTAEILREIELLEAP